MTTQEMGRKGGTRTAELGKSGRKRTQGPRCACGKMLLASVHARRPAWARLGWCGLDCAADADGLVPNVTQTRTVAPYSPESDIEQARRTR